MYNDPCLEKARNSIEKPPPGVPQGVIIPGSEKDGRTGVYRHWRAAEGELLKTIDPEITTMFKAFEAASRKWPDNKCLGWREQDKKTGVWGPYLWMDYQTVQKRRTDFGAGLVHLHQSIGLTIDKYGIGIWSANRPEWQITDLAAMSQSLYTVSIYDTLGPSATEYIINHSELNCVVASLNHIPTLLSLKERLPTLKFIISMDPLEDGEPVGNTKKALLGAWAAKEGVQLYSIYDIELLGQQHPKPFAPPSPDDAITINYTSGTTGFPKGVLLTHMNAVCAASCAHLSPMYQMPGDFSLSYLPLAHIYARVTEHAQLWSGCAIGYWHGNILELTDDLKALRPNTFISVPRLYNRFNSAIKSLTIEQGGVKGALSRKAVDTKLANLKSCGSNKHGLYDRLWGNKVRTGIGFDRLRACVSGSAPIAPSVISFLRIVFSNNFIEGYGLTETYAVTLGQLAQDNSAGNVGPPTFAAECVLRDVPEMGYTSKDKPYPRGELLTRGPMVFKGYYKAPDKTAEVLDADGWFATGDICKVDELGRFSIIDRVKNLLKLAQGEYVSPERVENAYLGSMNIFQQAYVHGDSFQPFLVAVIGVDRENFSTFAGKILKKTIAPLDTDAVTAACGDIVVRKAVLREMDKIIKKNKMTGFERVRNVHLCVDPFTIENDLLTPTLKLKRPPAAKAFKEQIDALYQEALAEEPKKSKL